MNRLHRLSPAALALALSAPLAAAAPAQQWTRQYPATFPDLRDVATNGSLVVAVGDDGQVLRTTDSGVTWAGTTVAPGSPAGRLSAVEFSGSTLLAGGDGLFLSLDGGQTWAQVDPALEIEDIETVGPSHAWAITRDGVVLRSVDGGTSWSSTPLPQGFWAFMECIAFEDTQRGWAGGHNGAMYRTNDGGVTWTSHQGPGGWTLFGMQRSSVLSYLLEDSGVYRGNGPNWTYGLFPWVTNARDFHVVGNFGLAVGLSGRIQMTPNTGASWVLSYEDGGWEHQGVVIVDPDTAFVVGQAGRVLRTGDAGASWAVVHGAVGSSPTVPWIRGMHALDSNTVFAAATDGIILRSDDRGATWDEQDGGTAQTHFRAVHFHDDLNGYAVGEKQGFYPTFSSTHDGGLNWFEVNQLGMYDIWDVEATGPDTAVAASDFRIWRTTNGGANWTSFLPSPSGIYHSIEMQGQVGYAAGTKIVKTSDGGVTWTHIADPLERVYGVAFADALIGWTVGTGGVIQRTVDGGVTWTPQASGVTSTLTTITAYSAQIALAGGENGVVLLTSDGGATWAPAGPPGLSSDAVRGCASAPSGIWISGDGAAGIWRLSSGSAGCVVDNYCVGKVHSGGGVAAMRLFGNPSVANLAVGVGVMGAIPNTVGVGFRSTIGPAALPVWNGTLCVQAPLQRMPVLSFNASGFGYYTVPMDAGLVGTSHWYQVIFRDAAATDGTGIGMTDGLKLTFCH